MLTSKKAWIWLAANDENLFMVKYINNNPCNTFTPKMEYRLVERKKITPIEWESIKKMCE